MKKQKICVIGGGITGLSVAAALATLNVNIDLIAEDFNKKYTTLRTTGLSNSNYLFLKELNLINNSSKFSWPCREMEIYDFFEDCKRKKILNLKTEKEDILHIFKNLKFIKAIRKNIKNNKNIKIKTNIHVSKLFSSNGLGVVETSDKKFLKYNLIIACSGKNSLLTKDLLGGRYFNYDYNETSITLIIKHNPTKNNIARQFFLKEGPFAFLPISNDKTSIVWSIKEKILKDKKNKEIFLKKI